MDQFMSSYENNPEGQAAIAMTLTFFCYWGSFNVNTSSVCANHRTNIVNDCKSKSYENCEIIVDNGAHYFCKSIHGDGAANHWCKENNFQYIDLNATTDASLSTSTPAAPTTSTPVELSTSTLGTSTTETLGTTTSIKAPP